MFNRRYPYINAPTAYDWWGAPRDPGRAALVGPPMATFPRLEYHPPERVRLDETIDPPLTDEEVASLHSRPGSISDVGFNFTYDPHYMPVYDPATYADAFETQGRRQPADTLQAHRPTTPQARLPSTPQPQSPTTPRRSARRHKPRIPFTIDDSPSPHRTHKARKSLTCQDTLNIEVSSRRPTVAPPKEIVRSNSRYNLRSLM